MGVEICHWTEKAAVDTVADVIIEAFACDLPTAYLQAMAQVSPSPCWINLEYLTAETWAESCHGMSSPHPSLPLTKYFYFPGFSPASGGLLREHGLLAARHAAIMQQDKDTSLDISLFCYETAPVGQLLDVLTDCSVPIRLHVAPGKPLAAVMAHLGGSGPWQSGDLTVLPFEFLPQEDFDRLLWQCDINFVRGEDSFVRAQWAGKPFIWQIYTQDEGAHLIKLSAFLERYTAAWGAASRDAAVDLFNRWNSGGDLRQAWAAFLQARPDIAVKTRDWADQLAEAPDLSKALVSFCATKV
jgi:uncharacterized repeat protein (TIGR03837 family)